MKGIYLCSRKHRIPGYDLDYNDIIDYPGINVLCDMMDVDISKYDFVIATPPCNYYSRANWRRETSEVAQSTKHLLPYIIEKCIRSGKPFIVENVMNSSLLPKYDICVYSFGQHVFYTNVCLLIDYSMAVRQNKQYLAYGYRDDNANVDYIIKLFLYNVVDNA